MDLPEDEGSVNSVPDFIPKTTTQKEEMTRAVKATGSWQNSSFFLPKIEIVYIISNFHIGSFKAFSILGYSYILYTSKNEIWAIYGGYNGIA